MIAAARTSDFSQVQVDTTFEIHYAIGDLARQWRLGRETVRLLVKDEPGVLKIRMGPRKACTRYSVPESVARRVHTKLFNPAAWWVAWDSTRSKGTSISTISHRQNIKSILKAAALCHRRHKADLWRYLATRGFGA